MKRLLIILCLIAFLLLTYQVVPAAAPTGYTLDWWTADTGGGSLQGGAYTLQGTVGQAEPGSLDGVDYSLVGGFWSYLRAAWERIFLPLVNK
jgi:hypothetical protein